MMTMFTSPTYSTVPHDYKTLLYKYNMVPTPLTSPPEDDITPKTFRPIPRYPPELQINPKSPKSNIPGFITPTEQTPTPPGPEFIYSEAGSATSYTDRLDMASTSHLRLQQHHYRRHDGQDVDAVYPINMLPSPPYTHSEDSEGHSSGVSNSAVQTEPMDLSSASSTSFASSRPSSRCSTNQASRPPSNGSFASPK